MKNFNLGPLIDVKTVREWERNNGQFKCCSVLADLYHPGALRNPDTSTEKEKKLRFHIEWDTSVDWQSEAYVEVLTDRGWKQLSFLPYTHVGGNFEAVLKQLANDVRFLLS